jgi:hypothetical protein
MFNHSEKDFTAASEVSLSDLEARFDLTDPFLATMPGPEKSRFIVGFTIALPLSMLMWAAIIAACYRAF